MRSGDRPGLQNRREAGNPVTDGFDSHSLPPFVHNELRTFWPSYHFEIESRAQQTVMKT